MNHTHQPWGRPASLQSHNGFAGRFIQDITAAASVATGQHRAAPAATTPPRRTITVPHTIQLCVHCRHNPAGFWVSRTRTLPARRPWCLSCCQHLVPGRYQVIPFEGHGNTGRFR